MNVLFICSGNVSRSFMAEMLLKDEIKRRNLSNISVASAGLYAYPGNPSDSQMVDYLSKKGIAVDKFEAKQITKRDVDWADLLLVMEKDHKKTMEKMWPDAKGKIERLGKFAAHDPNVDDIIDPFGKSPYHYRLAQAQITSAIKSLVAKLESEHT